MNRALPSFAKFLSIALLALSSLAHANEEQAALIQRAEVIAKLADVAAKREMRA